MSEFLVRIRRVAAATTRRIGQVRAHPDRGDIPGWAIMIPLAIGLFFTGTQVVMWHDARNMCQAAAQIGARAAAALNAGAGSGQAAALNYLDRTAGGSARNPIITEQATPDAVTVTCHADALRIFPLPGLGSANQSATAARERFTTPGSR
jgi:hypothetical protein